MVIAVAVVCWAPGVADAQKRAKAGAGKQKAAHGRIVGTVSYRGTPPQRETLDRKTDPVCAQVVKLSERVVVVDGKVRDVHVRIRAGSAGRHAPPQTPVSVNQLECMYTPRVVGLVEGQSLVVKNSDATYHNVRGTKDEHTKWNLGQPAHAPDLVREELGKAGETVTLRCDVHPWMRAYVAITDHPYFDVTADDGAFAIAEVPEGRYTLEAWHPELGLSSTEVVVKAGADSKIEFVYPSK